MSIPITQRRDVEELLAEHRGRILALGVRRLGLFGSFVRDEAHSGSDIDLLVEFEPDRKNYSDFFRLAEFLEEVLQRHVELVTPESLSPYIGPRILREVQDVPLRV